MLKEKKTLMETDCQTNKEEKHKKRQQHLKKMMEF